MSKLSLLGSLMLTVACTTLVSCKGGGSSNNYTPAQPQGPRTFPTITAQGFVDALSDYDRSQTADWNEWNNFTEFNALRRSETLRSSVPGQGEWFVIFDNSTDQYKAVSLDYIRSLLVPVHSSLGAEFRYAATRYALAQNPINTNGDPNGDYFEVVDFNPATNTYIGRNSGFEYEDQAATNDVSLLNAEAQEKEIIRKAANLSYAFSLEIRTSLSLVTLGEKIELMLGTSNGELTPADQAAIMSDLQRLTGVTFEEVMVAAMDEKAKDDLIKKIAAKVGTSASNLENRILPELFDIQL